MLFFSFKQIEYDPVLTILSDVLDEWSGYQNNTFVADVPFQARIINEEERKEEEKEESKEDSEGDDI